MYKKLFIPGPTHVDDEVLEAMAMPMIGHRDALYSDLHGDVVGKLKKFLSTDNRIYLSTSSSTGMMEGSIRNCVKNKSLMTNCGAFSRRWAQIAEANGKDIEVIEVEWGNAVTPDLVDQYLAKGGFDTVCITHNETSTGVMNPLQEIGKMVKEKYPDVVVMVDTVSSMAGAEILVDDWGLDVVVLAGTQKAFALPPGLCVVSVSDAALERSKEVENKGYYFDFEVFEKKAVKDQTPSTPAISQINALDVQMDRIFKEGVENRFQRHIDMAEHVRGWAKKHFALYSDENYLSNTVTNVHNTQGIDVVNLNDELAQRGAMISNGYGDLKGTCFRIAHMGDLTMEDVTWLTGQIDDILGF